MWPYQSRGAIHSSPKYATTGSDRGAEVVANPTGATVFHRPCISAMRRRRQLGLIFRSVP
jgi:hypothetical protein